MAQKWHLDKPKWLKNGPRQAKMAPDKPKRPPTSQIGLRQAKLALKLAATSQTGQRHGFWPRHGFRAATRFFEQRQEAMSRGDSRGNIVLEF
jgi:hypothetical protein